MATWWGEVVFDLKALMAGGFEGVVEGWVTTILTALEEGGGKGTPLDHKLVKRLLPDYLDEIAEAEGKVAELDGTIKAATASGDEDDEGDGGGDDDEEALSEAEIKALKKELSAAKAKLKTLHRGFSDRLEAAQGEVDGEQAEALVLDILKADLRRELDRRVVAHRQAVVAAVEGWWSKYRVTLRTIEGERDAAKGRLDGFLKELGYAG